MQNSTLFRRAAALLLTAALALTLVLPGLAAYEMPIQTVNEGEVGLSVQRGHRQAHSGTERGPAALHCQPDQDDDRPCCFWKAVRT